jgi:lipopolysaccharide biosynthesis protein
MLDSGHPAARPEVIAFYLPQFHPIPENDAWWGKGFTEWSNVARARPSFPGHVQPRLPGELGFYDLRLPETRAAQAELARAYGITAFCYYHYWFRGRRLLERPFNDVLESGEPDFPFLVCWANENWTRRWDGQDRDILMAQSHSEQDDRDHFRTLAPAFADPRYFRLGGRPVFLVYRTDLLPDARRTADIWREEAHRLGIGDIVLGRVENFVAGLVPETIGFDFAVEFAPRSHSSLRRTYGTGPRALLRRRGLIRDGYTTNNVFSYDDLVSTMLARPQAAYPQFRCACPSWDNTPRRKANATVFEGSTPEAFEKWMAQLLNTRSTFAGTPAPVFVNAWNEWAEGAHLEPCAVYGRGFLEAVRSALATVR